MPETQSRFGKLRMREVARLGPFFPDPRELCSSLPITYSRPGSPLAAQTELSNDLLELFVLRQSLIFWFRLTSTSLCVPGWNEPIPLPPPPNARIIGMHHHTWPNTRL